MVGACHQPQQWGGGGRLGPCQLPQGSRVQTQVLGVKPTRQLYFYTVHNYNFI